MLRKLSLSDLHELLLIEEAVSVVPWSLDAFKACFNAGSLGWGITISNKLIGFVMVSQTKEECHILNLAVSASHQRQGYGKQLLEKIIFDAKQHKIGIAYLEVRRSNTRAIALYKKMKFLLISERKDYYPTVSGREDALIFALNLYQHH